MAGLVDFQRLALISSWSKPPFNPH